MDNAMLPEDKNQNESFIVQIQFCRNATWQGTLTWIDQKKVRKFRSTLEMLKLMDSAINSGTVTNGDTEPDEGAFAADVTKGAEGWE